MALLPALCGHAEIQIQDVEVKCHCVDALFFPHADAGAEPNILHCTGKHYSCRTLTQEVDAFFHHFFLGRRPETLILG